jgi:hypothetical protein
VTTTVLRLTGMPSAFDATATSWATASRLGRQPFLKQTVLAALVVLVAVWLGHAPLGIVAVFFAGLATRLPIRPTGGPSR